MTTGPKKATPIVTNILCCYGCGNISKFFSGSGKYLCGKSASSCPINKKKNSLGLSTAHRDGKLSASTLSNKGWAKGLTKETDSRVANISNSKKGISIPGHRHTNITKQKLSDLRIDAILSCKHDLSGRKGHRGYYQNIYFHSSWELAYYVHIKETTSKDILRNTTYVISYIYDNKTYKYIPDFVVDGNYIEIKSYLFSERDKEKYEQSKNIVNYLFRKDIDSALKYCKEKYGADFWNKLYNADIGQ